MLNAQYIILDRYVSRLTSHWYLNSCTAPMPGNPNGIRVWETEIADLDDPWTTTWYSSNAHGEGLYWAGQIYQGIVQCQLSAFLYWWGMFCCLASIILYDYVFVTKP
jgi:hypothetical protein